MMFEDDEMDPWEMLVDSIDRLTVLEKTVEHLNLIIMHHNEILKQLLQQNEYLSIANKELTEYVTKSRKG